MNVLPLPTASVPLLVKAPAVVKVRPLVIVNEPELMIRLLMAANDEVGPSSVMFPALEVRVVSGIFRVAAFEMFQVPPVRVGPATWVTEPVRLSVPL